MTTTIELEKKEMRSELEALTQKFLENGGSVKKMIGRFQSGETEVFVPKSKKGRGRFAVRPFD